LSGEREFGVQLNKPFARTIKIDLPTFTGCYGDFLILIFLKLITDGDAKLTSLYEIFLTLLTNISPYIKSMAMITCSRLISLFKTLSRPNFLFENEKNHRYVFFLLETFNNCIQYQYEGNYNLIYALIRNQKAFASLANLQLPVKQRKIKITKKTISKNNEKQKEKIEDDEEVEGNKNIEGGEEKSSTWNWSME